MDLAALFEAAAGGRFPPAEGRIDVVAPGPDELIEAVVEFTGYAVIVTALAPEDVRAHPIDAFGGVIAPGFLQWLAGPAGWVGTHDMVLVCRGRGGGGLAEVADLDDHPRVVLARRRRHDVTVYGDGRGLVTLGRGLAGRREMSVELAAGRPGSRGVGRSLIAEGLALVAEGEPVFASVAPGNAASVRAFLAAGFQPIGAEVLIVPAGR